MVLLGYLRKPREQENILEMNTDRKAHYILAKIGLFIGLGVENCPLFSLDIACGFEY
jgi:hypothetical protein